MRRVGPLSIAAVLFACAISAPPVHASAHFFWKIDEVFSNIDGTVQFIDLTTNANDQNLLHSSNPPAGQTLASGSNTFDFPSDLPSNMTAGHHFLIATPGYAALPRVPKPDFVLPSNQFFDPIFDSLNYANVNSIAFMEELLPTDGVNALFRPFGATDNGFDIHRNLAINFAGASGSVGAATGVPLPAALWVGLAMLVVLPYWCPGLRVRVLWSKRGKAGERKW